MSDRGESGVRIATEERKSARAERVSGAKNKRFPSPGPGQRYPHHYPHRADFENATDDPLGEPLSIHQVARLLGCSVWTVRHRYLPLGLPYFRIGRAGKLMFYRKQIVVWILEKQKAERG